MPPKIALRTKSVLDAMDRWFSICGLYHMLMKADLRISVKDYPTPVQWTGDEKVASVFHLRLWLRRDRPEAA